MSSYKWKKLLRHVLLISLMLAICIVTTACAFQKKSDGTAYSEPTEVIEEEKVTLYFNVDREEYDGKGADGFTGREKDPDTGYFQIMFAGKGRVSLRRVADRRVVNKIDNQDVMALVQDENGIVTDIITVDECTGGYYMTGKQMYVSAVNGNVLTLYGNSGMLGSSYMLEYAAGTKIYDVSEMAEEDGTQGSVTTLTENDRILVIYDKDGSVGWIFVTERVRPMETRTMYCDHCQEEVTWYGWNLEDSLPTSGEGHYWLTEDVACSGQMSMAEDTNIVLDLNGHTVTGIAGKRIYSLHNPNTYLAIMDYGEAGTGKLVGGKTETMTNQGGIVWVRYGTFELYGGTLDASQVSGNAWGMAVHVPKDCVFRMFGGTIIGGTSVGSYEPAKDSLTGGVGGALYVDGTFDMRGGQIIGGKAQSCLKNGTSMRGNGGSVYISGTGSMSMSGGSITGGTADGIGGNVYVSGKATFTMSGSTWIANGQSKTGGNVYVSKNGIFTMNGGAITDGRATGSGGNVYAAESSIVRMAGGVIRDGTAVSGGGNVYVSGKSIFTLSGSAEIKNGQTTGKGKNGGSVYVAKNGTFNMNGGVISGGTTRNGGGNMVLYGTLNMTDGVITGGKTLDYTTGKENTVNSKNLFVVNSTMNMSGGRIDGYVGLTSTEGKTFDVTISGTAKIKGTAEGQPGLIIPTGKTIKVGKMEDGAEVYVTASGTFSEKTDAENAKYFHSDDANKPVNHYDGCLANGHIQCDCGASATGGSHVGDCDGETHLFTAWTSATSLPTTPGRYYLTKDIDLKGQTNVKTSGELVLDLNGHTVTSAEGKRVYALWTDCQITLSIMDTSTAQTGKLIATGAGDAQGRVLWLRADHTVNLYSGTLDASEASGGYGLAICSETKSTINMYGGKIIGGEAPSDKSGGAVRIGVATFNMYGGEITGGTAKDGGNVYVVSGGKFLMQGGTIYGGTATGRAGNIYIGSNSTLTISGEATVVSGKSGETGGNVYVSSKATVEMSGGEIKNGTAANGGGNVYVLENGKFTLSGSAMIENGETTGKGKNGGSVYVGKNGTFNMNGGTISGGTSRNCAGNMAVYGTLNMTDGVITGGKTLDYTTGKESGVSSKNLFVVNGTMNMSGGQIDGYVGLTSTEGKTFDATISGTAKIKGTAEGQPGLIIPTGKTIKVGKMEDSAEVYVTASGTFSEKTDAENAKYFHSDDANKPVNHYDGCLANGHIQCDCGASVFGGEHLGQCDGKEHLFTAWTSATSLPTTPGRYYLTKDVALTGQINLKTDGELVLDLNGHTVTGAEGKRVYALWTDCQVTLSIMDTSTAQTGKLIATGAGDAQGRVLWLRADHTVNLYSGTLDASGASGGYGVAICSEVASNINMYGGTIIGGNSEGKNGGAVYIAKGNFRLSGGTISGGASANGCSVYVAKDAVFAMVDGEIKNGPAVSGGNMTVNGTLKMSGGTIAGYVALKDAANVEISGTAKIMGGQTNLDIPKEKTITVGEMKDGAEVYVTASGTFTTATDKANAKCFHCDNREITVTYNGGLEAVGRYQCVCGASLNGGTHIDTCDHTERLFTAWTDDKSLPTSTGYYYLTADVELTAQATVKTAANIVLDLNGHQVSRPNDKTGKGQRIYSLNKAGQVTLTIADSKGTGKMVAQGSGTAQGRIIWCQSGATVNLYGGTLDASGASGCRGLAICSEGASTSASTINMYGGTIIGGQASGSSGVSVRIANATFNMHGGTITGGTGKNGGNVYVGENATFNMTGGTISGGTATKGGNIYIESNGKLTMSGGSIDAGVYLCATDAGTPTCEISGEAKIINEAGDSGVMLEKLNGAVPLVAIQDGFAGTIYVDATETEFDGYKIATAGADSYTGNIVVRNGYFLFYESDGSYALYDSTKYRAQCICGASLNGGNHVGNCDGKKLLFTEANKLPTISGNYYLTGDVKLSGQVKIESDATIVLDLNGYEVTRTGGGRILALPSGHKVTLSITDSSAEHSGKLVGSGTDNGQGIVIWLNGEHTLNLYGGTLDASKVAVGSEKKGYGLAICGSNNATINMYGGTIIGGDAGVKDGGAVHINSATFNMIGGEIKNGKATNGGNVYVDSSATFNMTGGKISGGTAQNGGNVYVRRTGKLAMSGGSIDAGVYLYASDKGTPTCEISGEAKIINEAGDSGIMLGRLNVDAPLVAIQDGFAGTIYLDATETEFDGYKVATASADSYTGNIVVRDGYFLFYESDGSYALYDSTKYRAQCICGASLNGGNHVDNCDGTKLLFTPWTKTNELPKTSGNYYLTGSVTLNGQQTIEAGASVILDLNGCTVSRSGRIYVLKGNLSITDSASDGTMKSMATSGQGAIIWVGQNGAVLNLYGGIFDASGASGMYGSAICSQKKDSVINMYGGTIIGGKAGENDGGTVYIDTSATFNMYGGSITDGIARKGGNVFVKNATFNMYGGTIKDGKATNGGNVYVGGGATLTMTGGTITGGTATEKASNLYIISAGKMYWNGGTIDEGENSVAGDGATNIVYPTGTTAMEIDACTGGEAVDETAPTEAVPVENTPVESAPVESTPTEQSVQIATEPTEGPEETETHEE